MEQRSINFLRMTSKVIAGMLSEKEKWDDEIEISNVFSSIESVFTYIGGKNQIILSTDKTGFTSAKDNLFEEIIHSTHKLTLKMSGYAKIKKDYVLLPLVDISLSTLSRGPEKEAVDRCSAIVEKAGTMLPQLLTFKVTEASLAPTTLKIKDYRATIGDRSTAGSNVSVSGEEIDNGISSLHESLDILDDLVEGISEDEEFIARYKSWRKIDDFGKDKTLKNPKKP